MAGRLYRRGGVWYCWGYDARGRRWRESTGQLDRKAAEIVSREVARRRAAEGTAAEAVPLGPALSAVKAAAARAQRSPVVTEIVNQKGRHLIAFFGADFDLARATARDLERYADRRRGDGVSQHTIAKELHLFRRARIVARLPWSKDMLPDLGRFYVPRKRWLPEWEVFALALALSETRRDYLAAFVFTGADSGELYRVRARDVDLARGTLRLPGTKTAFRDRVVPIAAPLRAVLERRLRGLPPDGVVFPLWHKDGRDIASACVRAGIERCSPKDLRRTFCSWLAQRGAPMLVVARLMGHASTKMVEHVYAQLGIDVHRDAIALLGGAG